MFICFDCHAITYSAVDTLPCTTAYDGFVTLLSYRLSTFNIVCSGARNRHNIPRAQVIDPAKIFYRRVYSPDNKIFDYVIRAGKPKTELVSITKGNGVSIIERFLLFFSLLVSVNEEEKLARTSGSHSTLSDSSNFQQK
jgi:hypothetical protein